MKTKNSAKFLRLFAGFFLFSAISVDVIGFGLGIIAIAPANSSAAIAIPRSIPLGSQEAEVKAAKEQVIKVIIALRSITNLFQQQTLLSANADQLVWASGRLDFISLLIKQKEQMITQLGTSPQVSVTEGGAYAKNSKDVSIFQLQQDLIPLRAEQARFERFAPVGKELSAQAENLRSLAKSIILANVDNCGAKLKKIVAELERSAGALDPSLAVASSK